VRAVFSGYVPVKPSRLASLVLPLLVGLALSGRAEEGAPVAASNPLMDFGAAPVAGGFVPAGGSALQGSPAVKAWSQGSVAGGSRQAELAGFRTTPAAAAPAPATWSGEKPWIVGDGTNFTQVIPIIPEPSTYGALFLAAASGVVLLHRRRAAKRTAP
jgi:hypothetical protein